MTTHIEQGTIMDLIEYMTLEELDAVQCAVQAHGERTLHIAAVTRRAKPKARKSETIEKIIIRMARAGDKEATEILASGWLNEPARYENQTLMLELMRRKAR